MLAMKILEAGIVIIIFDLEVKSQKLTEVGSAQIQHNIKSTMICCEPPGNAPKHF